MHTRAISCRHIVVSTLLFPFIGCAQPAAETGPSYSELVVTYNAELEALDRLETKREKLVAEYAAAIRPASSDDTLSQLGELLESARDLKGDIDTEVADPNALLDQLAERSESAEDVADKLVDSLLGGQSDDATPAVELTAEQTAELDALKAKYDTEIAALDKEIATQKDRVERAREARDAAEASRQ